jgi:hypothetical protein
MAKKKKSKIPKIQFQDEKGKFVWLTVKDFKKQPEKLKLTSRGKATIQKGGLLNSKLYNKTDYQELSEIINDNSKFVKKEVMQEIAKKLTGKEDIKGLKKIDKSKIINEAKKIGLNVKISEQRKSNIFIYQIEKALESELLTSQSKKVNVTDLQGNKYLFDTSNEAEKKELEILLIRERKKLQGLFFGFKKEVESGNIEVENEELYEYITGGYMELLAKTDITTTINNLDEASTTIKFSDITADVIEEIKEAEPKLYNTFKKYINDKLKDL